MNIDKETMESVANLIAEKIEKIVFPLESENQKLRDLLYRKNGEITDLHTRINSLEHLLDLARSKNV